MENEDQQVTALNTTPFINRSKVKDYAIQLAKNKWKDGRFSRVGMSFLERVNDKVRHIIASEVSAHPTLGKTLK